jgi:hypothetical protein
MKRSDISSGLVLASLVTASAIASGKPEAKPSVTPAASNAPAKPAASAAPSAPATGAPVTDAVYLKQVAPKLVSSLFTIERTEDQKVLWSKIDPKWIVHTTAEVTVGGRICPNAWNLNYCQLLDTKDTDKHVDPKGLPGGTSFTFDKYGWAMGWDSTGAGEDGVDSGWFMATTKLSPLAKNTPGVVIGPAWVFDGGGRYTNDLATAVRFLAVDGTTYFVQPSQLAMGSPAPGDWPTKVQHVMYIDSDDEMSKIDGAPDARPWEPPPAKIVDDLHAKRAALKACNAKAWKPSEAAFAAIDNADILETTRENRRNSTVAKFSKVALKACRGAFVNYAKSMLSVNDDKYANRSALLEANRTRFAK